MSADMEERNISEDMANITNEEWKPIPGYDGYFVSNFGNVRSEKFKKPRIMKGSDNGYGYLVVGLCKDNVRTNHYVHRLVAQAFVANPSKLPQVNHKDYNKKNNNADNLEWTTALENTRYSLPRMHRPRKKVCSATGYRHITLKGKHYRLNVGREIDKIFKTLDEALKARNEIYIKIGYDKWLSEEMQE